MWVEGGGDIAAMTGGGARHIEAQWGIVLGPLDASLRGKERG